MLINKKRTSENGFTLIEMMVVAPIVILAIGAFLTVIISMTGEVIASRASNTLTYNVQDALNRIEQDVQLSATFLAQNNVTLTGSEAQGYNDDATNFTNVGGTSGTSLILNMVATTDNPLSTASQYIFLKDQPNACGDPYDNIPLTYNVIYFVKDNALWRRVVMPSQYANTTNYSCVVPWQQPSCSPTYMSAQTGTVFCKTNDVKLVDGVSTGGFTLEYYTGANGTTASTTAVDTGASVASRNTALIPITTLRATITANQTAGGRDISHSANIRTTRLATNASAIVSLTPSTTPVSPSVTGRTDPGAKAVFDWPAIAGATGYTFEYNINGGGWVTGFTNQPTRTYTVSAPANEDVVNARVTATNAIGTSGYGTASVTIPLWEPLILINGWNKYDNTYGTPSYTKTRSGVVVLKGVMKRTAAAVAFQAFATLPVGYRPDGGRLVFGTTAYNNVTGRIDVEANGNLLLGSGSETWTSLDSVRFVPSGGGTRVAGTLVNGWTNYGGDYAVASSVITNNSRVFTQGLVVPGTTTSGTRIYDLPNGSLPSLYQNFATRAAAWGYVGLDYQAAARGIQTKGVGASYLATTTNFMSSAYAGSWTTPTLQNSWVTLGGIYSTHQYTKTTDNLVTIKGHIRLGTVTSGTVLFNIPASPTGFRPRERLTFTNVSNDAHARIDVDTNGDVILMSGGNNTWLALDGITYVGEQ